MTIFLYGEDTYRSQNKLKEIVNAYKKKNPSQLSFQRVKKDDFELEEVKSFLETRSMFSETRLLVVENFFELGKPKKEDFLNWLDENKFYQSEDEIIVFYEQNSPDKRTKVYKTLEKEGKSEQFEPLEGRALRRWIEQKVQQLNPQVSISSRATSILARKVGNDLWAMKEELEKLINYTLYQDKLQIEKSDLKECVRTRIETDIFDTIDAVAKKNKQRALELLKEHFQKGEPELKLLGMFCYQFRNLLRIKDLQNRDIRSHSQIKERTDLHPFVVKKLSGLSSNFTLSELKEAFTMLFRIDKGVKTGKIKNPSRALERFVVKVAAKQN